MNEKDLLKYKHSRPTLKPNAMLIPITTLEMNSEGIEVFNEIYKFMLSCENYGSIQRTPSGGISYKTLPPAWDIRNTSTCVEITIMNSKGLWRFQCRNKEQTEDKKKIHGRQAFLKFKEILKDFKINLEDYEISNGIEVKKEIPSALIEIENAAFLNLTHRNAHHIDFHSSYPAGLINTHPEFKDAIKHIYSKRKEDDIYKAILNYSIGFMQSKFGCQARWAHLAKDAIEDNLYRIKDLAAKLTENGRQVLLYNTDGIWYSGEIFHGENEGSDIGQWENDHTNCKLRIKSSGAYEFIENGKYVPVVRGSTRLDTIKPRDKWEWGDIYKFDVIKKYYFIEGQGLIESEELYD